MTEPLPCPFCGHVGVSQYEGSTFRWLATECNGCGAQCSEERINTMTMERSAAIEQAKVAAIETWNTRAAQRKPLTDEQAKTIAYVGPVFAPDGVVKRSAPAYRQELERHRMDAIRRTEAAHNINE